MACLVRARTAVPRSFIYDASHVVCCFFTPFRHLPEDCDKFDGTNLPFDWYLETRSGLASLGSANFCSGVCLPKEISEGGPYVSRNMDFAPVVEWYTALGKEAPEGTWGAFERGIVLEFQPDTGYRTICSGPNELMMPWGDGINEKGLWMSCMYDPQGGGANGSPPVGGDVSGLVMTQLHQVILTTCATVVEAKEAILKNRIMQTMMPLHMPIVDATGAATVFEIDIHGSYTFSDRKAGEPLFSTNHPIHVYPTPETYPKVDMSHEHNTFVRQFMLRDAYSKMKPPFTLDDASKLVDVVHCSFKDAMKAEAQQKERTLANVKADLSKPEMSIRWHLRDVGPIAGTNQVEDVMSGFHTFGFK